MRIFNILSVSLLVLSVFFSGCEKINFEHPEIKSEDWKNSHKVENVYTIVASFAEDNGDIVGVIGYAILSKNGTRNILFRFTEFGSDGGGVTVGGTKELGPYYRVSCGGDEIQLSYNKGIELKYLNKRLPVSAVLLKDEISIINGDGTCTVFDHDLKVKELFGQIVNVQDTDVELYFADMYKKCKNNKNKKNKDRL